MSNKTSLFNLISTEFTGLLSVNTVDVMNIISHQIEDTVINHKLPVDFFAGFQRYSFLNRQRARYERLARIARRVFVFGIPDDKTPDIPGIEYIPLDASDSLAQEWFLVINTPNFYTALMTREVEGRDVITGGRRFEGVWTYDERIISQAYLILSQYLGQPYSPITDRNFENQNKYLVSIANNLVTRLEFNNIALKSTQGLLKSINNVSRAISISESLDEYLELTANSIMNSFQVRTVTIWKADYDADEISLISAAGLPSNWRSGAYVTQPIGRGQVVASSVPQDGKTIYINNTQQENAVDLFDPAAKSILSIPIYVKGTTLGVLQVTNHKAHAFNKDAIKTLESLAAQIGLAMLEETQLTTPNVTTSTSQSNENIDWLMFEGTLDSVIVLDKDKTVAYINNAALHTFNLQDQMVIGQTIQALNEPQLLDIVGKVNMKSRPNYQGAIDLSGQLTDVSIAPRYNSTGNGTVISTSSNGWIMTLRPQNQVEMIKQPVTNGAAVDPELARELTTRVQNLDKLVTMLPSLGDLAPTQEEAVNRISQLNFDLSGIAEKLSSGQRKTNHNDGSNNLNGKNGANGAVAVALETSTERSALLNTIQAGVGEKESVNVASILADVIKRVSEDANQQQKTIQPDIANDLPLLYCNEKQIHQAISELVDNAIKYCPPKTKIRLVAGLDQDQIILAVRDNGKGIWLKDTPMLFEPGFRVENEETQAVSGEGLGLTIVKVIAENHGGRAIVETRVGRGSIFLLKLPNA